MSRRAPGRVSQQRRRRGGPVRSGGRGDCEFKVFVLPSARAVARCAAGAILDEARRAIARRGRFLLAIPGGATPLALFAALGGAAREQAFDWSGVTVVWVDERRVPYASRDSNAGSAVRHGLAGLLGARLLPMPAGGDAERSARAYEAALRGLLRAPSGRPLPLDTAVLGVGADGHVASLFPGSAALAARRRWVVPASAPAGPRERLTLTLPVLRAARLRLVLVTGRAKREIVARALAPPRGAAPLPVHLAAATRRPTVWLVDRAAAGDALPAGC
jgi:6-phosphogluconolactonase